MSKTTQLHPTCACYACGTHHQVVYLHPFGWRDGHPISWVCLDCLTPQPTQGTPDIDLLHAAEVPA